MKIESVKKCLIILLFAVAFSVLAVSAPKAYAAEDEQAPTTTTAPMESIPEFEYTGTVGEELTYTYSESTQTLTISGNGVTMDNYQYGTAPWYPYAEKITAVKISSAENLNNIGSYAFCGLVNLKSVSYSSSVTKISKGAFQDTGELNDFTVKKSVKSVEEDTFKNSGLTKITFNNKSTKVYDSPDTIPKRAKIYSYNPSKAYSYAVKYKRATYVFVSKIDHEDYNEILRIGEKYAVPLNITPQNASNKKVTWYTTNKKIASVSKKGVVKALKKGICYVYAKSKDVKGTKSSAKFKIIVTNYNFTTSLTTLNNCYKECRAISPKGIVVHSTGVNNTNASRYAVNWNMPRPGGREVAVHGFLGRRFDGSIGFVQCLPFNMACWGCGGGAKGSYNYNPGYIQFECCEDSLSNRTYFNTIYEKATDLCAYLCLKYNISYKKVTSHREAHFQGYASNHGDIDHWLFKYGLNMNSFRKTVKEKIYKIDPNPDLTSGAKYPKVTIKKDTYLYSKNYIDDYGKTSKKLRKLKKGDTVRFVYDRDSGWSRVKTESGKKGYVMNSTFSLEYLSHCYNKKVKIATGYYSKPSAATKYKAGILPRNTKVKVICKITSGSKKGWDLVKYKNKEYYVQHKYLY